MTFIASPSAYLISIFVIVAATIAISSVFLWIGALLMSRNPKDRRFGTAFITVLIVVLVANVVNVFVPKFRGEKIIKLVVTLFLMLYFVNKRYEVSDEAAIILTLSALVGPVVALFAGSLMLRFLRLIVLRI